MRQILFRPDEGWALSRVSVCPGRNWVSAWHNRHSPSFSQECLVLDGHYGEVVGRIEGNVTATSIVWSAGGRGAFAVRTGDNWCLRVIEPEAMRVGAELCCPGPVFGVSWISDTTIAVSVLVSGPGREVSGSETCLSDLFVASTCAGSVERVSSHGEVGSVVRAFDCGEIWYVRSMHGVFSHSKQDYVLRWPRRRQQDMAFGISASGRILLLREASTPYGAAKDLLLSRHSLREAASLGGCETRPTRFEVYRGGNRKPERSIPVGLIHSAAIDDADHVYVAVVGSGSEWVLYDSAPGIIGIAEMGTFTSPPQVIGRVSSGVVVLMDGTCLVCAGPEDPE